MKMKVIFASFQGISNGKPQGMVRLLLPIFEEFCKNNRELQPIYYIDYRKQRVDSLQDVVSLNPFFSKIKNLIGLIVGKLFFMKNKRGWARLLQEHVYDYFLASKIEGATLLVSSCYSVRAFRKNRRLGGKNILLAGNPDDRTIFAVLELEKQEKGVEIEDPYTLKSRVSFINRSIELCDRVMYHTSSQLDSFSKTIPMEKSFYKDIVINPAYITGNRQATDKDSIFFCYIAHTVWLKGLTYLLECWRKFSDSNVELIVGGSIDSSVQRYIIENDLTFKNVKFIGPVNDLSGFYGSADVCIIPSLIDGGPVTVAEALTSGMPVICSSGCGSKTLVNKKNGLIVDPKRREQMEDAIEFMIDNFHLFDANEIKCMFAERVQDTPYKDFSLDIEKFYQQVKLELTSK